MAAERLDISGDSPSKHELGELHRRAERVFHLLRREDCEAQHPFFFEFSGTPRSGKCTIIGIIGHFLRR